MDSVKIDGSFVRSLKTQADRDALRTLVTLARTLGKQVIAEGVETSEQLAALREAGCDRAQGFLFCAPVDRERAQAFIERGRVKNLS